MQTAADRQFFRTPFSKQYWHQAAREVKNTRMLVFAAMMIAIRVALKPVGINIGPTLRINTAFTANAIGAMVMGPVLSMLCAAVTDTLGCLLFPSGPYFFPFIFVEMAGSLVFSLFLYRTKLKPWKIILSRFCICFFVNIVFQTPIMLWYYAVMYTGKTYAVLDLPRIAKNLVAFPIESIVLMLLFRPILPALRQNGFVVDDAASIKLTKKTVAIAAALALLGGAAVTGFYVYDCRNNSLSAGYSAEERFNRNEALRYIVQDRHPELKDEDTVCIIESAYLKEFKGSVTYHVAVYEADLTGAEKPDDLIKTLRGLSKSKAKAREELTKLFDEDIVLTENAREPEKGTLKERDGT